MSFPYVACLSFYFFHADYLQQNSLMYRDLSVNTIKPVNDLNRKVKLMTSKFLEYITHTSNAYRNPLKSEYE
jgi:hypothetical protein